MSAARSDVVDIVREFLVVYRALKEVSTAFHAGELCFEDVRMLVDDRDGSALFRLKERSHARFREGRGGSVGTREALFDLAVGSLFHEAMKFRENLYQHEVYGPRVRGLREEAGEEAGELFGEFEKILAGAALRREEALLEVDTLLDQTREQLRVLLVSQAGNGLITRTLIEREELVDFVFPEGLEGLLAAIHGDAARGYEIAAHSYLRSAFFDEALEALAGARMRSDSGALRGPAHYAEGMQAFLGGRYERFIECLDQWAEGGIDQQDPGYVALAHGALMRIHHLVDPEAEREIVADAVALARRIEPRVKAQRS